MFVFFFVFWSWIDQVGVEYYLVIDLLVVIVWCVFEDLCGYWVGVLGVVVECFVIFDVMDDYLVLVFFDWFVVGGEFYVYVGSDFVQYCLVVCGVGGGYLVLLY